jgi:hypothetical protein
MGSRPSPAEAFQAWGLRRTLRRSSPASHLFSIAHHPSQLVPKHLYQFVEKPNQEQEPLAVTYVAPWSCATTTRVCAYPLLVRCNSKGAAGWRDAAMSRGAEPEGCRLPCAKLWAHHCHGGRMVVVQRAPGYHWFGLWWEERRSTKGPPLG